MSELNGIWPVRRVVILLYELSQRIWKQFRLPSFLIYWHNFKNSTYSPLLKSVICGGMRDIFYSVFKIGVSGDVCV